MYNRLKELRARREDGEGGFTLIELLVVVVIIGILVAIAIPLYLHYRQGAEKDSAKSDTRNAVPAIEQCFTDNGNKWTGITQAGAGTSDDPVVLTCGAAAGAPTEPIHVSSGNTMTVTLPSDPQGDTGYTVSTVNDDSNTTWVYSSTTGQLTQG